MADPAARGALPSFATIYKRYFDFIWSSARRLGVPSETLDDVVQEVFVIIYFRLDTVEQPESLQSWIYSVVRRTVSRYHRTRKAKDASLWPWFAESLESVQQTPEYGEQRDQRELLAMLLRTLEEPQREVFVLTELEEMTGPEIAAALEIPLNTVYSRLRAGRLAFEQALARHTGREKGERA